MWLGLIYLSPGSYYPTHAHDATELYHTLLGTALWGPSKRHLKPVEPDNFVLHPSALPHAFEVHSALKSEKRCNLGKMLKSTFFFKWACKVKFF